MYPVSQITSGKLIASQMRVRLDGVCAHSPRREAARVRVGVGGADASLAAAEFRVVRFVGDDGLGESVSYAPEGLFRVATMARGCWRNWRALECSMDGYLKLEAER